MLDNQLVERHPIGGYDLGTAAFNHNVLIRPDYHHSQSNSTCDLSTPIFQEPNVHSNQSPRTSLVSSTSPTSTKLSSPKASPPQGSDSRESAGVKKRTLNTLAARRYRQRRVDQVAGLESALKETEAERDALKTRVARLEGELDVLRALMGTKV